MGDLQFSFQIPGKFTGNSMDNDVLSPLGINKYSNSQQEYKQREKKPFQYFYKGLQLLYFSM